MKVYYTMEVATTAGATITVIHDHTGEMTTKVTMMIGEIEVAHYYRSSWGRGGRDSWSYGPTTSNPRDRDRFITEML